MNLSCHAVSLLYNNLKEKQFSDDLSILLNSSTPDMLLYLKKEKEKGIVQLPC